jgi:prepilin-type N-terminal cleavage/methylation domain-containing protein
MSESRQRQAFSLLELLVVVSLTAVLITITTAWIHQTLSFSSAVRKRQTQHLNCQRLNWQFRDDVRQCQSMQLENNQLQLTQNDGSMIQYTASPALLRVEKRLGDRLIRQEEFAFEPGAIVHWDTSEMPTWISLEVLRGLNTRVTQAESSSTATTELSKDRPVVLHVRVRANRWAAATRIGSQPTLTKRESL